MSDAVTIDIHGHVIPMRLMGHAGPFGPEVYRAENGDETLRIGNYTIVAEGLLTGRISDPKNSLARMDEAGIDILGVSIAPMMLLYWLERDLGVKWAAEVNDALAEFCKADPDRLFFIPTLPLQDIEASIHEMDRARSIGGRGIYIGSEAVGRELADEYFWPVYEHAEKTSTPILIHPYPVGQDGDPGSVGKEDAKLDWSRGAMMTWMVGYLHQETLAISSMLLGGVFDAFPNLKVSITHGGGSIPYQFGRLEQAQSQMGEGQTVTRQKAQKPLRTYLKNLYFDSVIHDPKARQYLVDFAGADNVLIGSNFGGWDGVNGAAYVRELGLDEESERKILSTNAARLFGLEERVKKLEARR